MEVVEVSDCVKTVWQKAASRIRDSLGEMGYETWITPLKLVEMRGHTAVIEAPNLFFRDCVSERYRELIEQVFAAELGEPVEAQITVAKADKASKTSVIQSGIPLGEPQSPKPVESKLRPNQMEQGPLNPELNPRFTFDEFVVGSSNQFAHAAALAVSDRPGEKYNPLFIYGGVGLGKTHLASAIGHRIRSSSPNARRVLFMPAESFMNELIGSIRRERMEEFKEKFRKIEVLILDDVQFLAGRERTQEEFFHTFNALHSERHQIVLTSDKVPREITGLEERLRNRFESGLIADIAAPDLETRVAILQKKATFEGIALPGDVAMYVAQSVNSSVRELEGCLVRLSALASVSGAPINVDFARDALRDLIAGYDKKPDIEAIQQFVSDRFHIRLTDLKSKRRTQRVAFCRQVAMYLCRKMTASSFPSIGEQFGRDHSTVIHAFNLVEHRATNDPAFRRLMEEMERGLSNSPVSSITRTPEYQGQSAQV
jgi:chromosomal replication initiator protein